MPEERKHRGNRGNNRFPDTDFERIFHPASIAILGVSSDENSVGFGTGMLRVLKEMGFAGRIYPVNPSGGSVLGLKIYSRMEDIPERVDFAVIAVTAKLVPQALEDCLRSGVAGAEILSSGFGELGTQEGRQLEDQIREITARGIRVVGPNCFGIYCPRSGLTMLPGQDLSRESGNVAFLAQSGGMASDFAHAGEWMGIRFSKMVSFGNGADLREAEHLGPDGGQLLLGRRRRLGIGLCALRRHLRRGQGPAVHLPVRAQGQPLQPHRRQQSGSLVHDTFYSARPGGNIRNPIHAAAG